MRNGTQFEKLLRFSARARLSDSLQLVLAITTRKGLRAVARWVMSKGRLARSSLVKEQINHQSDYRSKDSQGFKVTRGWGKYDTPDALIRRSYPLVRSNN